MIKTAEQHLVSNELKEIVDTCPIAVRDIVRFHNQSTGEISNLKGISMKIPYRANKLDVMIDKYKFSEYGIGLSAYCDNIPETLLHEACHVYRARHQIESKDRDSDERETEFMTAEYFSFSDVRNKMVDKTIEVLGIKGF